MKYPSLIIAALAIFAGTLRGGEAEETIQAMQNVMKSVNCYQAQMIYHQVKGNKTEDRTVEFTYKRPGWIRNHIIKGKDAGTIAVYDPGKGIITARLPWLLLPVTFDPGDARALTLRGERMYETHLFALLRRVDWFHNNGEIRFVREDTFEGKRCRILEFSTASPGEIKGVARELCWFDVSTSLPVRLESYDSLGRELQWLVLRNIELNPALPSDHFKV